MCQAWGESAAHSHTRSRARTAAREPLAPAAAPRFSSWQREPSGRGRWPRESESGLRGVGSLRADRAGAGGGGGPHGRVLSLGAQPRGSRTPRGPSVLPPAAQSILPGAPRGSAPISWGWGSSPSSQPALAAPPGTPAQRRHCGC